MQTSEPEVREMLRRRADAFSMTCEVPPQMERRVHRRRAPRWAARSPSLPPIGPGGVARAPARGLCGPGSDAREPDVLRRLVDRAASGTHAPERRRGTDTGDQAEKRAPAAHPK